MESSIKVKGNKYQVEIKNLNDEILLLKEKIKNKDDEILLFKNSFVNIQIQLQERNISILEHQIQIDDMTNENLKLKNDSLNKNLLNVYKINDLENNNNTLLFEKDQYIRHLTNETDIKNNYILKYDNLKIKYQELLNKLEVNNALGDELKDKQVKVNKELTLLIQQHNTLKQELETIKKSFS